MINTHKINVKIDIMTHLIDKSAVVAEIKRRIKEHHSGYLVCLKDILSFVDTIEVKEVQEEPVSEELEEAAFDYAEACKCDGGEKLLCVEHFKAGAKWQAENLWKPADGDCLPEIDREVIALLDNGKVVYAHRPSEHWDGKNIDTGKVTRYYPKTYDKGGWNIPNLKYWLDYPLPE
jgi:hypothetical protein